MRIRGGWFATTAGAQLVTAVAGMATNVIYARTLELPDFGVVAITNAVALYVSVLGDRGIGIWATRTLATGDITPAEAIRVAGRLAAPVAVLGLAVMVPAAVGLWSGSLATVALLSVPLAGTVWLFQLSLTVAQGAGRTYSRSVAVCGNGIGTFAVSWIGMLVSPTIWVAIAVSGGIYIAAGGWLLHRCQVKARDVSTHSFTLSSRKIARDCIPLFATNAANYGVVASDLLLASVFLSPALVGRFQVTKKIGQSTSLPLTATNAVLLGKLMRMDVSARSRMAARVGVGSWVVVIGVIFSSSLVAEPVISTIFGSSFTGLSSAVIVVLAAYYFQYLKDLFATVLNAAGHDRFPLVVNVFILSILGLLALIDQPANILDVAQIFLYSVSAGCGLSILYCSVKCILQRRHAIVFILIGLATVSIAWLLT